jgi:integrase
MEKDLLPENPFEGLRLDPVPSRDRVLSDDELAAVWRATDGSGPYDAIIRMLILTGQRRDEVAAMTWNEISPDLLTWTIPAIRAKNSEMHIVPLSPQAQGILGATTRFKWRRERGELEVVFPGRVGSFSGFSKAKAVLDEASGVKNWRVHDLRRTVATNLQKLGMRLEVTEAVLNHVSGSRAGIVGIYQRHSWANEKRAALAAWGVHVEAIVNGHEADGNVTVLRQVG